MHKDQCLLMYFRRNEEMISSIQIFYNGFTANSLLKAVDRHSSKTDSYFSFM